MDVEMESIDRIMNDYITEMDNISTMLDSVVVNTESDFLESIKYQKRSREFSFSSFLDELSIRGIWRGKITSMEPNITDNIDLLGKIIVEIPETSWGKVSEIKNDVLPISLRVKFSKMKNPLKTTKYTYILEYDNDKVRAAFN